MKDEINANSQPSYALEGCADQLDGAERSVLRRLWTVLERELNCLNPEMLASDLLVRMLPHLSFPQLRTMIYRLSGVEIGKRTIVFGRMQLTGPGKIQDRLHIGAYCTINSPVFINLNADVTIGDHVAIGHHTVLVTADHEIGSSTRRGGALTPKPITIGDGCLIGACVTILPGVKIGKSSIVAPGSLVSADVPPCKMVGGVPSRVIKSLSE